MIKGHLESYAAGNLRSVIATFARRTAQSSENYQKQKQKQGSGTLCIASAGACIKPHGKRSMNCNRSLSGRDAAEDAPWTAETPNVSSMR